MAHHVNALNRVVFAALIGSLVVSAEAAEVIQLDNSNWHAYAPQGKEVDAIYGDFVLRNDKLVAVVAQATTTRHANLTVKNVGGALIDLTRRERPNDQLSAFYPHGGGARLNGPIDWQQAFGPDESAVEESGENTARLAFRVTSLDSPVDERNAPLEIVVGYELMDGADFLVVVSKVVNNNPFPQRIRLQDGVRADGEFQSGFDDPLDLWWAADEFWGQAYGIQTAGEEFGAVDRRTGQRRDPQLIRYTAANGGRLEVPAKRSLILRRHVFPGKNSLDIQAIAHNLRGLNVHPLAIMVSDSVSPVDRAQIELRYAANGKSYASGCTDSTGRLYASLPIGEYEVRVQAQGRKEVTSRLTVQPGENTLEVELSLPGYVEAHVVDEAGQPLPCKVSFTAQDGGADPYFGPDSAVRGVRNLQYTPDGHFRVEIAPGRYKVVISHGPEFDAILKTIVVRQGETLRLEETLVHSVDTTGWLSADFHSHSSPSGDNTASQRGRVLNLLAEHIEFAPCTEHNRVSTYTDHLSKFNAAHRMATCCGMELTGQPLPLNHQNAFPLVHRPNFQDGGGPATHVDPVVQIERLAMWDDGTDKLVQINHPNIVQMLGDRDEDGKPDGGFERMFHFMDVIEVHPPGAIFEIQDTPHSVTGMAANRMFNWLQLLNLGYRLPGVVNTDAHWNFHGSGWLRNYIRSPTDDPGEATIEDLVRESELGHIVMTNGPFLGVEARAADSPDIVAIPGDDLVADGGAVSLRVRVQCPNWLEVNRVQLFVNGRPLQKYNYTRRSNGEMFTDGPIIFDQTLRIMLPGDAHIVVAAAGEGRQLGVVYGARQGDDSTQGAAMPVAVANAIFVDVDGDGFDPNGDTLGLPLPVEQGHRPSHGHNHANFHNHSHPHDDQPSGRASAPVDAPASR